MRMLAVRTLLVLAVRIGSSLRTRCTAGGCLVRTPVGVLAQRGKSLPGATEVAELFGGELQGLQVGAQSREADYRAGRRRG
ncbi:hypothetical protein ACWGQL_38835 [Streptomyces lydicus]